MSSNIVQATIKVRRDTAANFTSNNPTPNAGEWCKETDTDRIKIGDGSTAWTSLAYKDVREDTAANFTSNNPTLFSSEFAVESDTGKFKIGDGSTAWTSLGYAGETGIVATVAGKITGSTIRS